MSRKSGATLPEPVNDKYTACEINQPGWWLILSDCHVPYHDKITMTLAVAQAVTRGKKLAGVILNGDILDFHGLSSWDKSPDDPRYANEVSCGRQLLEWLRNQLPHAKIIWKDGNHEERLKRYLIRKAPDLWGLDVLEVPSLLEFQKHRIEYVTDCRLIKLGHLNVLHGHEYRGASSPVNPARGLFLRASASVLAGHWHQTSEHHQPTLTGKPIGCWSTGCACQLDPRYCPFSKWNHGFAMVELLGDGMFSVENKRVINGKVV